MNSIERMQKRLQGLPVDRIPNFNIFMGYAAHAINKPLSKYYSDYRVLCAANLEVLSLFELDIVQTISDPYREGVDFGLEVHFPEDDLPVRIRPLIVDPSDIHKLRPPDPGSGRRMSDRLKAVRRFKELVGGEVPIMGWVEGALALANVLRGDTALLLDLYDRPEWLEELLEICAGVEIEFARQQVLAGADVLGLGDAVASLLSPEMYKKFALPYEQRIFSAVHELGALARLHICGNITHILPDVVTSGADLIDLDWMVDLRAAAEIFGDQASPVGNFDPVSVMARGKPDDVERAILDCIEKGGQRCFIAAGCEIPDGTPEKNLFTQMRILKKYGFLK